MEALARIDHLRSIDRNDDAERLIRAGLAEEPQDAELLWRLASVLLHADRTPEALEAAQAACAADPASPDAHRLAGLLLAGLRRPAEALQAGYTAVTLAPEHAGSAIAYAYILQCAGRLTEAAHVAYRAVQLAPHDPNAHLRVADVASDAGDIRRARAAYNEALRLDPTHAVAQHDLAVLDARTRHPGRALHGLVAAGRLNPSMPQVLVTVAAVLWQVSWRLRIGLIIAVILVVGASGPEPDEPSWTTRICALVVIAVAAFVAWWSVRELPAGTRTVLRAALRGDRLLQLTWLVIAVCLVVYLIVAVSGVALLAVLVWPAMIFLAVLALIARLRNWTRSR